MTSTWRGLFDKITYTGPCAGCGSTVTTRDAALHIDLTDPEHPAFILSCYDCRMKAARLLADGG